MVLSKYKIEKIREYKKQGKKYREIRALTGAAFDTISKYGVIKEPPLAPSTTSATKPNINQTVSQSPSTSFTPKTLSVKNLVVPQEQIDQFDKILKAIEKNQQSSKDNTRDFTYKELEQRVLQLELDKQAELKTKETLKEKQANEPKLYDIKQHHVQPNPQPTQDPILKQITKPEEIDTTSYDKESEYFEIQPYHLTLLCYLITLSLAIYTAKRTGVFDWSVTKNKSNKIKTIKPDLPSIQAENKKFYQNTITSKISNSNQSSNNYKKSTMYKQSPSPNPKDSIYFLPIYPPDDPSDCPLMQQIKKMTGRDFELYLKRFFDHQYYKTELTKVIGDRGADLILRRGLEYIVVQAKQWKENVGSKAIQEAITAKLNYKANHAIVICTSKFTREAIELASNIGVDLWDEKRVMQEIYKHEFFLLPE